jgi:hypothetical protein
MFLGARKPQPACQPTSSSQVGWRVVAAQWEESEVHNHHAREVVASRDAESRAGKEKAALTTLHQMLEQQQEVGNAFHLHSMDYFTAFFIDKII